MAWISNVSLGILSSNSSLICLINEFFLKRIEYPIKAGNLTKMKFINIYNFLTPASVEV